MADAPEPTWAHDVDLIAAHRYLTGEPPLPPLTETEQDYVLGLLTDHGIGSRTIATRLGIPERSVTRWRTARRE